MSAARRTLLLLIMVTYLVQGAFAVASPCLMMSTPTDTMPHQDHAMDHGGHDMASMQPGAGDCCDGGFCSMSECQMAPGLPSAVIVVSASPGFHPPSVGLTTAPDSPPEAHYRPPTLA